MGPIIPHLWFDSEAVEAAQFYAEVFPDASVDHIGTLHETPGGDCDFVDFRLAGQRFMAISAGPHFRLNPSISFLVNFDPARGQGATDLDALWDRLLDGGTVRMELGAYPFSKRYGWIEDKYGVNWQLILTDPEGEPRPMIVPAFLFVGDQAGNAEAAIEEWTQLFPDSKRGLTVLYPAGMEPEAEGFLMFGDFQLCGQWFAAMDSADAHDFAFTEALSMLIHCQTQDEMDALYPLSAVPEAEQCGWVKDRFGVSWQITPTSLHAGLRVDDREQIDRLTRAFLPMKRLDKAALDRVIAGA